MGVRQRNKTMMLVAVDLQLRLSRQGGAASANVKKNEKHQLISSLEAQHE
jgi:hypothetical protein